MYAGSNRAQPSRARITALALLAVASMLAAGCTRSSNQTQTNGGDTPTTAGASGGTSGGSFGDLKNVCGSGNAKGATDQGVTDKSIKVGTISDPGFVGRPGLNQEMFDAAEVFTKWCNDAGGINGRKIEDTERDAKLTEYKQRITEACQQDFMLVGGGGVFDETGQAERLKCLLPDFPAYQVSSEARGADLAVRSVPNSITYLNVSSFQYLKKQFPDAVSNVGFITGNIAATLLIDKQSQEAVKDLGFKTIFQTQYNAAGEASWTPFAQAMQSKGVKGIVYTGEPENLAKFLQSAADIGYKPDWVVTGANALDDNFLKVGGAAVRNVYLTALVVPPFLADKNPATQQYLDLFKKYLPKGKSRALLGYQGFSAWLLWAQSVKECGSGVTRKCVFEKGKAVKDWTGGGLHAANDPGSTKGSDCSIVVEAGPDGFSIPKGFKTNKGLFKCSPDSLVQLKGDYGKGVTLASVGKSLSDLK
jgi:ABC-type branched-subunit amino acid transport system substrate-binding protein